MPLSGLIGEGNGMPTYDAFISYSQAKDVPVATALQGIVQTLGKPWYKLRELRVFRDATSIPAEELWPSIEKALRQTRYAILLASPESARSPWVGKEMAFWLANKGAKTLMIGLTKGDLKWDNAAGDFVWTDETPLPPVLKGAFQEEPRYVDLRPFRETASRRDAAMIELGANFVAKIRDIRKEDLLSEELRQQRRALRHAWSAAAAMLVLAIGVGWYWWEAATQRDKAEATLAATTESANSLVVDVAAKTRRTVGVPAELTADILDRVRNLQEQLIASWSGDERLARSRAVAHRELAQTLLLAGDKKSALDHAMRSRDIMEALLRQDATKPELRSEFSRSLNRIGEAYTRSSNHAEAEKQFQQALAIRKELAKAPPTGDAGQAARELAVSYERTGDALFNLGKAAQAREMYRENFNLRKKLAEDHPANREWQGDLAVAYDRIGARVECDPEKITEAYRGALRIREALVAQEPRDANWQQDLAASYNNVGVMLLASKDIPGAIKVFGKSVEIRQALASSNPGPQSQAGLVISLVKLAEAGDKPREHYQRALEIVVELETKGKLTASQAAWRSDLEERLANPSAPLAPAPSSCKA